MIRPLSMLAVLSLTASSALAGGGDEVWTPGNTERHARVSLAPEFQQLAAGQTITIGLALELDPGWHIYWKGTNDTGYPLSVAWEAPEGVAVGEIQWPVPERHVSPGNILDHVYEHDVTLLVPVSVAKDVPPGRVHLQAKVSWLICQTACIPEEAEVTVSFEVVTEAVAPTGTPRFHTVRSQLPVPLPDGRASVEYLDDAVRIEAPGAASVAFYPYADCVWFSHLIEDGVADGPELTLRLKSSTAPEAVTGVLEVISDRGTEYFEVHTTR